MPSVPNSVEQPPPVIKPKKPAKPKPTKPGKPVQKITPLIDDMDALGDPYVDTMECRPTDVSGDLPGAGPF